MNEKEFYKHNIKKLKNNMCYGYFDDSKRDINIESIILTPMFTKFQYAFFIFFNFYGIKLNELDLI